MAQSLMNLSKDVKFTRLSNDAVAATADVTSGVVDMQGFDSVLFFIALGDITSGCVLTATAKTNTANSTSSPTPVAVTGGVVGPITAGTTDNDNGTYLIDVQRPLSRYVFVVLNRTTQNAVVDGIWALQYNAKTLPVTQDATTILQTVLALAQ